MQTTDALTIADPQAPEKPIALARSRAAACCATDRRALGLIVIAVELFIAFIGPLLLAYDPIDLYRSRQ